MFSHGTSFFAHEFASSPSFRSIFVPFSFHVRATSVFSKVNFKKCCKNVQKINKKCQRCNILGVKHLFVVGNIHKFGPQPGGQKNDRLGLVWGPSRPGSATARLGSARFGSARLCGPKMAPSRTVYNSL